MGTGASPPEEVDLNAVLGEVLADFGPAIIASGARVPHGPLPPVWGRRSLLGQLLQNLVGNALKFTRPDVTPSVDISATDGSDGVTVRVVDNGIGIDGGHRSEVFGVFTRLNADEQFPGSGIGLATCAKVVAYHGGHLRLEDGIDGGVAVVVWLPSRAATGS